MQPLSTKDRFLKNEIRRSNHLFSPLRSIVETSMYSNNVQPITSLDQAYQTAHDAINTIVTDLPVKFPDKLGLPSNAKILVENGNSVVGRTAAAKRIYGENPEEDAKLKTLVLDAICDGTKTNRYKTTAYVGLDPEFMVKAHLTVPKGQENNLYSWLLNFQVTNEFYNDLYKDSQEINEGDILIYQDANWHHPDYPLGLAYFDSAHNCAIILGMNYFGELKKSTLTLAWNIAHNIGYVSCHGGQKKFVLKENESYVAAFFGLSGSGKSTLTHAKHNNKYEVEVLHDDAFIISLKNGSSIALEPAYFDKTQDYPADHPEVDYFVTVQNVGVTQDENGNKVLLTEDLRNGNGRTIKSRYSTPNRVDKFEEPINAVFWIMKDDSLPPVLKINDPILATTFGATLATKRTTAERLKKGVDINKLVIEPYANPFRVYPLIDDYNNFKYLFEELGTDCYILNTGFFLDHKIPKEVTLGAIESIIDDTAEFQEFGHLTDIQYMVTEDFKPDFTDSSYVSLVDERMKMRGEFIREQGQKNALNVLPNEALKAILSLINES